MNPIERALGILLMLTGGKLVSAIALAERFEVTPRTIYRDIDRPAGARRPGGGRTRGGRRLPARLRLHPAARWP